MYKRDEDDGPKDSGSRSFRGARAEEPRSLYDSIRLTGFVVT